MEYYNHSLQNKFIDSARFMANSLSNLVDNPGEEIHKIKCKDCDCFLKHESVRDNLIKYKCLSCNKDYSNRIDEKFKKWLKNTFKFSNNDINKLLLLLTEGVYPYEYMNERKKFNGTSFPKKEDFYSHLIMDDITNTDYFHTKKICQDSKIKNLGEL